MGSTPRKHRYQLPLATRSTDVAMMHDCPGRWVLTHFKEADQAEASFFALGSALHEGIEAAVLHDLDLEAATDLMLNGLHIWISGLPGKRVLESANRGVETILDDARTMLANWFTFTHPDSAKRLDIYDEYEWPPRVEVSFLADIGTKYPVWGQVDAIFDKKDSTSIAMVDWKSSRGRQRSSDQLHFYQAGYGYMEGDLAWFHNVARVQGRSVIQMADPYPGDAHVRQRILATEAIKDSIIEGGYPHFNQSALCNWCTVQDFCPVDGAVQNREQNMVDLRQMLRLARPMIDIDQEEREVA